jgi:hypothetical protein
MTGEQTGYEEDIDVFWDDVSHYSDERNRQIVHCLYYKKLVVELHALEREAGSTFD